jgi:hypothetical protein
MRLVRSEGNIWGVGEEMNELAQKNEIVDGLDGWDTRETNDFDE